MREVTAMADQLRSDMISSLLKRVTAEITDHTPLAAAPLADGELSLGGAASARTRHRSWSVAIAVAVCLAVAVPILTFDTFANRSDTAIKVYLPGLTVTALRVSKVRPRLSAQQAITIALASLQRRPWHPIFTGYSVTSAAFEAAVTDVRGQCGSYRLNSPHNVWVVEARAPAQDGWRFIRATVLVDDNSGSPTWGMLALAKKVPAAGVRGAAASCA